MSKDVLVTGGAGFIGGKLVAARVLALATRKDGTPVQPWSSDGLDDWT